MIQQLADEQPAPAVYGVCIHCRNWATGPRYESTTPPDQYDLISSHAGCPGRPPADKWRPRLTRNGS